jgi:hypothetical protein
MRTTFPTHNNFLILQRCVYVFRLLFLAIFIFCYSVLYLYVVLVTLREVTHLLKTIVTSPPATQFSRQNYIYTQHIYHSGLHHMAIL